MNEFPTYYKSESGLYFTCYLSAKERLSVLIASDGMCRLDFQPLLFNNWNQISKSKEYPITKDEFQEALNKVLLFMQTFKS